MLSPDDTLFILLHDAWVGAWAWEGVQKWLEDAGWYSATLDLPGRGAGAGLSPEQLNLHSYAQVVARFVKSGAAPNIVLVGHGTGSVVAQAAAEIIGLDNLAGFVAVQGIILHNGETIAEQYPPAMQLYFEQLARQDPAQKIDISTLQEFWYDHLFNDNRSQATATLARLIPEPAGLFFQPIKLEAFPGNIPFCAYLSYNEDMSLPNGDFHPKMPNKLGVPYRHVNINAGHFGLITKPRETAESLIFLVTRAT